MYRIKEHSFEPFMKIRGSALQQTGIDLTQTKLIWECIRKLSNLKNYRRKLKEQRAHELVRKESLTSYLDPQPA